MRCICAESRRFHAPRRWRVTLNKGGETTTYECDTVMWMTHQGWSLGGFLVPPNLRVWRTSIRRGSNLWPLALHCRPGWFYFLPLLLLSSPLQSVFAQLEISEEKRKQSILHLHAAQFNTARGTRRAADAATSHGAEGSRRSSRTTHSPRRREEGEHLKTNFNVHKLQRQKRTMLSHARAVKRIRPFTSAASALLLLRWLEAATRRLHVMHTAGVVNIPRIKPIFNINTLVTYCYDLVTIFGLLVYWISVLINAICSL